MSSALQREKKKKEFPSLPEVTGCHLNLKVNSDTDSALCFLLKGAKGNYHDGARQLFLALFWHSQHLFLPPPFLPQFGEFFGPRATALLPILF